MHPYGRLFLFALCGLLALPDPATAQTQPPPPRAAGVVSALVEAVRQGDTTEAARLRALAGPVGVRLAIWLVLRDGDGTLAAHDAFARGFGHWPQSDLLERRAEALLATATPDQVRDWFAGRDPRTTEGALALIAALPADDARARARAADLWQRAPLTEAQEQALLAAHPELRANDAARMDALLWQGAHVAALRAAARLGPGQVALARARQGLQTRAAGVNALIAAVPAALAEDPGLAHDRFAWRLAQGLFDEAADLLRARSVSAAMLGRPQAWATGRIRLVRRALAGGDAALAYDLARDHHLEGGVQAADLEFLAGFVALRLLNRPDVAAEHFRTLRARVSAPISLARAGYWEGRAHDAAGRPEAARAAHEFAAAHQIAYYGQLSAEWLGLPLDPALTAAPAYPDWRQTDLAGSDLLQAAILLHQAGQWHEARRFVMHLAESLTTEADLGALADLWLDRGEANFAVNIAKIAVTKGIVLPRAYFPLTGLEDIDLPVPADLVLAIARRESEFDARVVSHADARGLMQVLPGTGAQVARRLGLAFEPAMLTDDPAMNVLLGAAYLDELTREFGAVPLVAAAYNAGPGRPRAWITEIGDPRDPAIDPVDWVEMIPFAETRTYVMRVLETLVVYRAMLSGQPARIGLTDLLRGRS